MVFNRIIDSEKTYKEMIENLLKSKDEITNTPLLRVIEEKNQILFVTDSSAESL